MLQSFRNFGSTIYARIFLIILALSFVAWGIGDYLSGGQQSEVFSVNGTSISAQQFAQRYEQQIQNLSQNLGVQLTPEQANELGLPQRVFSTMLQEELVRQFATDLELAVPPARIRDTITTQTFFHDQNGFNAEIYKSRLRTMGLTTAAYERQQARRLLLEQLGQLFSVPPLPSEVLKQRAQDAQSSLNLAYVELTAANLKQSFQPTQEELTAFYQQNQARYQAPAVRTATVIPLTLETIATTVEVRTDEIQTYYDNNSDRFSFPPERQVEQIVFPTAEAAQQAYASLQNDADFTDVAAANAATTPEQNLGWVVQTELPDAYAEAVFEAELNTPTQPIESPFGWHIFRVTDTRAAGQMTLDEVASEIRTQLQQEKALEKLYAMQEQIEDQLAGGATAQEVAQNLNLPSISYQQAADEETKTDLPADVVQTIWQTPANSYDNVSINMDDMYYLYVNNIKPAAPQPLADVQAAVTADWRQAQIQKALQAQASKIQQAARQQPLQQVVPQIAPQARIQQANNVQRSQTNGEDTLPWLQTDLRDTLYYRGNGATEVATTEDAVYVIQLTGVREPNLDAADMATFQTAQQTAMRESLVNQFVLALQNAADIDINQAAIDNLLRPQG